MTKKYNISVIGAGYVGLSNALILSKSHNVCLYDLDLKKIDMLKSRISPIKEKGINDFLQLSDLEFLPTNNIEQAYSNQDFILVAVPTNFDESQESFHTETLESVLAEACKLSPEALIVIKSTIPIGFTERMRSMLRTDRIVYSPEFLREGTSIEDNLNPSRIIIGGLCKLSKEFGKIMVNASNNNNAPLLFMPSTEAECVKLFSNSYLAMRVAFFNELDSFAIAKNISSKDIIEGIKQDPRIGNYYNNPSFGYGGYCLPKDTKQLLADFKQIDQSIFSSIVLSNKKRKSFLVKQILREQSNTIGIYKLSMKAGSDNYRESAVIDIINELKINGKDIIIFDPLIEESKVFDCLVINDLDNFIQKSDFIIANRIDDALVNIKVKIFSRDIYHEN